MDKRCSQISFRPERPVIYRLKEHFRRRKSSQLPQNLLVFLTPSGVDYTEENQGSIADVLYLLSRTGRYINSASRIYAFAFGIDSHLTLAAHDVIDFGILEPVEPGRHAGSHAGDGKAIPQVQGVLERIQQLPQECAVTCGDFLAR